MLFICVFPNFIDEQNTLQGSNTGFYIQVVNYALPILKGTSFNEDYMANSTFSMKSVILNYMGLNLSQPDTILKKELSYLNATDSADDTENNFKKVADFNLNTKDIIKNTSATSNDNSSTNFVVYNPSLKNNNPSAEPEVLIYHSHTTESYGAFGPDNLDPTKNVCAVGDELAKTLSNDYGISVIHDKTIHNATDYNGSYARSRKTLEKYLKEYGDFKMIIDIHRDSDPDKNDVTANINGENVGKFMFVMAKKNPHYDKNMIIVNSILNTAKKDFPQLIIGNGMYYYDYGMDFFNQDLSNNAFLLEIGSVPNTLDESKGTTKYIARAIAEYLKGK
jgi:stage II sporulation protein P